MGGPSCLVSAYLTIQSIFLVTTTSCPLSHTPTWDLSSVSSMRWTTTRATPSAGDLCRQGMRCEFNLVSTSVNSKTLMNYTGSSQEWKRKTSISSLPIPRPFCSVVTLSAPIRREPHRKTLRLSKSREKPEQKTTGTPAGGPSQEQPTTEKGKDVSGESGKQAAPAKPIGPKYWVAERSIGEFSRAFNFAHRVSPDGVTAELKSGVLSVHVPKASDAVIHTVQVK